MKVLFLDIDGVLNSKQEVIWHRRIRMNRVKSFFRNLAYSFLKVLRTIHHKLAPQGNNLGWELTNLSLFYLTDHCDFDPIACSNIQLLLDEVPDLRIVVSSTWRGWGLKWCKRILGRNGIDPDKVIDITGREAGQRGVQCTAWLERAKLAGRSIDGFVAIDDDGDFECMKENLVQTDSHVGFTIRNAYKAATVLGLKMLRNHTLFDEPKSYL